MEEKKSKMRIDYTRYILKVTFLLLLTWTISCSGRSRRIKEGENGPVVATNDLSSALIIKMISPAENAEYKLGDQVKIVLAPDAQDKPPDSVKIFFDGKITGVLKSAPWEHSIPSSGTSTTGRKSLKAVAFKNNKTQAITRFVIIYSDVTPKKHGFKVIHTYPHDSEAFTQGLFYDKGLLYEGTGQETSSSLREVELETGKVLRQLNLGSSLFGEGITLYNDKIYQVTWTSKVGFIYEKPTFKLINKIYYQTQGWGLTTINDKIVMSDGTNVLYLLEPEMFNVVSRIEVYDNEKKVDQLNELEYINGEIWANIWQSDLIARIDPASGKVNSYIDMTTIFPQSKRRETNADVLNGIAWDSQNSRIFVTGKRWPKLYEIRVTE